MRVEEGEYVICGICGFVGASISEHVRSIHGVKKEDYESKFGSIISNKAKTTYSKQNEHNGDWIARAKEKGVDLSEFKRKVAEGVSATIMANPNERKRRSELMATLNQRDDARERASKAAKITSARKDIQLKRAEVLKKWREDNPEEFKKYSDRLAKSPKKSVNKSKVEVILFEILEKEWDFKRNVRLNCPDVFVTNKTGTKEVDLLALRSKIIVEFDGPSHFRAIYGDARLERQRRRDEDLLNYCRINGFILARLDDSTFLWRRQNSRFVDGVIDALMAVLRQGQPGVYYFGGHYVEDQIGHICWVPENT